MQEIRVTVYIKKTSNWFTLLAKIFNRYSGDLNSKVVSVLIKQNKIKKNFITPFSLLEVD